MPSSSRTRATAPINASVFFRGKDRSSFASFQSGRIELKILLCCTCPAITACETPSWCMSSIVLLNSPRLTQWTRFAARAISGEASSLIAMTAMSIPWLRAPSRTRKGNLPFPAMSPQPAAPGAVFAVVLSVVSGIRSTFRGVLFHDAALGGLDKSNQLLHVGRITQCLAHLLDRVRGIQFRARQQPERPLENLQSLRRENLALQADGVNAIAFGLALGDDERRRRHALRDHCASTDVGVAPHAAKLMHRGKCPDRCEILDVHMAGESRDRKSTRLN